MHSVFFWKSWIPSYRTLFYTVAGIFLFALLFLWFGYFHGADGVIQWEKFQEQKMNPERIVPTGFEPMEIGGWEIIPTLWEL